MTDQQFAPLVATSVNIPVQKVKNTLRLLADGATIPFISRYRKEATGSLDEVEIGNIEKAFSKYKELAKRKESILATIEAQGQLTGNLKDQIEKCWDATSLEDIYLPYKPKRKTRASVARDKGLEPLAQLLFEQRPGSTEDAASKFITGEVPSPEAALQGARDIIAEWLNEDAQLRNKLRLCFEKGAVLSSKVVRGKEAAGAKFKDYFEYSEPLRRCPSHRILALRRGEAEGYLRIRIAPDEESTLYHLQKAVLKGHNASTAQVQEALHDSYKRLLQPAIETEFRNKAKERADQEAIAVFAENLRQLLLSPPLGQRRVLGIDPGYRTGCKVVCLSQNGDLLHHTTIYPHPPQQAADAAAATLKALVSRYNIEAIAIGNGTAGRETMALCQHIDFGQPVEIFMVNEAGASVYSASQIAREEFPDHDVTVRGAVSIGRRLMDPLAELVKIDPKSIGVGQYQHDVNQTMLKESLTRTVEHCVNAVGINLNTASQHLLTYASGLGPALARSIVAYRSENGNFRHRSQLKKVPRLGAKAFEQAAGFLRIKNGEHPLDDTAVHPESYRIVERMAKDLRLGIQQLIENPGLRKQIDLHHYTDEKVGLPTLRDILSELEKPGLDPRGKARVFQFGNVHSMEDLSAGMVLPGIVTNITNFGAFVDIGVKQDGLVHISQIADKFIKNPAEVLALNQEVQVKVLEVDIARKRINLSIKAV